MLGSRKITTTLAGESLERSVARGCPHGGILSHQVWMNSQEKSMTMPVIH